MEEGVMSMHKKSEEHPKRAVVLIVDDEDDLLRTTRYIVKGAGYEVHTASDGEIGLKKAIELEPDLIILDLMLPKMPGEEVCRQLRKHEKMSEVPIIMLTAKNTDTDRIVGRVIGADTYMTKPFEIDKLLDEIKRLIAK